MIVPLRGVILDQDPPVIVDGERNLVEIGPGLVHPDGVVVVDEPLDRGVRVPALCGAGRLPDGQSGLGSIRYVQFEMQQAVVSELAAGRRVPGAHPAGDGFAGFVFKHIIVAIRAAWIDAGSLEPGIFVAGMVQHIVHINFDTPGFGHVD